MTQDIIKYSTPSEGVVLLTINRPQALNALNQAVFEELSSFFSDGYKNHQSVHGIIITGSGEKAFVAGADIQELNGLDVDSARQLILRGHEVMNMIENFHIPVIAAVNGYALGGGLELAMACHLRLASENALFGLPELKLGLIPGYGGTQRLVTYVGRTRAIEMMLTSDFIKAATAEQYGLVNKVVSVETLLSSSIEVLSKVRGKGPLAVKQVIKAVNAYGVGGMHVEQVAFQELLLSDQGKEGTAAFLEKRTPDFKW